jgi:hypothetical protein
MNFKDREFQRQLAMARYLPEAKKRTVHIALYASLDDVSYEPEFDAAEWIASRKLRKRRGIIERKPQ